MLGKVSCGSIALFLGFKVVASAAFSKSQYLKWTYFCSLSTSQCCLLAMTPQGGGDFFVWRLTPSDVRTPNWTVYHK